MASASVAGCQRMIDSTFARRSGVMRLTRWFEGNCDLDGHSPAVASRLDLEGNLLTFGKTAMPCARKALGSSQIGKTQVSLSDNPLEILGFTTDAVEERSTFPGDQCNYLAVAALASSVAAKHYQALTNTETMEEW